MTGGSPRAGVVGGGFMGEVHTRSIRVAGGVPAAIVSSTPERGAAAAARLGVESALPDLDALLGDPSIDVVHVCTPNASHEPIVAAVLTAGKHVVCEKPLGVTGEQSRRLAEAADAAGVVASVPFVYRFHPLAREARERILSGAVGPITTIQGSYLQDWLLDAGDQNWRVDPERGGASRAFADIGSHLVDFIEFVTGDRIAGLQARTRIVHSERNGVPVSTEDLAAVLFETAAGAVGTLLVSQVAPGRKNALVVEIAGASEALRFEQERPDELWIGRRAGSELLLRDPLVLSADAARLSAAPAGHPLGYLDAFTAFISDTYTAIREPGGALPTGLPTFADGARAAELTDAVIASARTSEWKTT